MPHGVCSVDKGHRRLEGLTRCSLLLPGTRWAPCSGRAGSLGAEAGRAEPGAEV